MQNYRIESFPGFNPVGEIAKRNGILVADSQNFVEDNASVEKQACFHDKCGRPFEPFEGKIPENEVRARFGIRIVLPRFYLFGTQPLTQYIDRKRVVVESRFKSCGSETCLSKNPPFIVPSFEDKGAKLAIVNGHHRIRSSGKERFLLLNIPCHLLTLEEYMILYNEAHPEKPHSSLDEAREHLEVNMDFALNSFGGTKMKEENYPKLIQDVKNIEELIQKFKPAA